MITLNPIGEAIPQNGQLTFINHEIRQLQLKGKAEPVNVWVTSTRPK